MNPNDMNLQALTMLRDELALGGRTDEIEALDQVIAIARMRDQQSGGSGGTDTGSGTSGSGGSGSGGAKKSRTYLKLKKKYYTPAEVAKRVGVSRQTVVKWIERGELEAETTPGGHHRIPASVFYREGRGESVQLLPADDS